MHIAVWHADALQDSTLPAFETRAVKKQGRTARRSGLRRESERALIEQIRRLLALPMAKRMNFVRKRRSPTGSML